MLPYDIINRTSPSISNWYVSWHQFPKITIDFLWYHSTTFGLIIILHCPSFQFKPQMFIWVLEKKSNCIIHLHLVSLPTKYFLKIPVLAMDSELSTNAKQKLSGYRLLLQHHIPLTRRNNETSTICNVNILFLTNFQENEVIHLVCKYIVLMYIHA